MQIEQVPAKNALYTIPLCPFMHLTPLANLNESNIAKPLRALMWFGIYITQLWPKQARPMTRDAAG